MRVEGLKKGAKVYARNEGFESASDSLHGNLRL
jgi:hypothetical protein